jgi:hypothetical protein
VQRAVAVVEVPEERADACHRWFDELRLRRAELSEAWTTAGLTSFAAWFQPDPAAFTVRVESPSITAAREHLAESVSPFDRWFRDCEQKILGASPLAPGASVADLLVEYHPTEVDPLDLFIAAAMPLLPGRVAQYRETITEGGRKDEALDRVRRWGLGRLDIWLDEHTDSAWAVYDAAGDLAHMLRDLATSDDEAMVSQRGFVKEMFGIDLATSTFPLPTAAWSWTA